jgi:oxygen-independent coproporphyrinogen III oxidase
VDETAQAPEAPDPHTLDAVFAGMQQVVWSEPVDERMSMSDTAILGLRLLDGISLEAFQQRHGCELLEVYGAEIRDCIDLHLLILEGDRLRLTRSALLLANEVFTRLLPKAPAL